MSVFQLGDVPRGFVYSESGEAIDYRYGILLAVPQPNQDPFPGQSAGVWGDAFLSLGTSFGDVRIRVVLHDGTKWGAPNDVNVLDNNGRSAQKLPKGTQKIFLGRVKKAPGDWLDDNPVGWLLEYV